MKTLLTAIALTIALTFSTAQADDQSKWLFYADTFQYAISKINGDCDFVRDVQANVLRGEDTSIYIVLCENKMYDDITKSAYAVIVSGSGDGNANETAIELYNGEKK